MFPPVSVLAFGGETAKDYAPRSGEGKEEKKTSFDGVLDDGGGWFGRRDKRAVL